MIFLNKNPLSPHCSFSSVFEGCCFPPIAHTHILFKHLHTLLVWCFFSFWRFCYLSVCFFCCDFLFCTVFRHLSSHAFTQKIHAQQRNPEWMNEQRATNRASAFFCFFTAFSANKQKKNPQEINRRDEL